MNTALVFLLAVLLDHFFGEPSCWHPLVGFGILARKLEKLLCKEPDPPIVARVKGVLATIILTVPVAAAAWLILNVTNASLIGQAIFLYITIAAKSLRDHARAVAKALQNNDLDDARKKVSLIVSRDNADLQEPGIIKAAIESVLENGSDAVFGALFWFAVAGVPGAIIYRLVNTLDAMWGYKTSRYLYFGWACARLDDVLSFVPARLTALTYAMLGNFKSACNCWRKQAPLWYSPNAGPVMAAGAGALEIELGGAAIYHGQLKDRPVLGVAGKGAQINDIERALHLVQKGILLWVAISFILAI